MRAAQEVVSIRNLDAKSVTVLLLLLVIAGILVYTTLPMADFAASNSERQSEAIEQAITSAVLQCYALEGSYPPDLDYLREHYGVVIDDQHFYYQYEIFAANVRPSISVTPRLRSN